MKQVSAGTAEPFATRMATLVVDPRLTSFHRPINFFAIDLSCTLSRQGEHPRMKPLLVISLAVALSTPVVADQSVSPPASLSSKVPAAKPDDVKSIDAILLAVYDVISGPAGDRNWDRFRSLFIPGGRLTSAQKSKDGSNFVVDVEGYATGAGDYFKTHGFFERSINNRVERFGNMAQVFSSYESRNAPNEKPFARGINSVQLFFDGQRWWIVSILWDEETPTTPIPADMSHPTK
jgi:hypothetical protein